MPERYVIPFLLATAAMLANLVIYNVTERFALKWPHFLGVFGLAFVFSELALLGLWLVWGRGNVGLRMVAALPLLCLPAVNAASSTTGATDFRGWYAMLLCHLLVLASLLWAAQIWSVSLVAAGDSPKPLARKVPQFSIWSLLSATTGLACVLAASRVVHLPAAPQNILYFLAGVAAISGINLFISFSPLRIELRVILAAAASGCLGFPLCLAGLVPAERRLILLPLMCVLLGVCTGLFMAAVRIAGFRLASRRQVDP